MSNTRLTAHTARYRIGETNAKAVQAKKERLYKLLELLLPNFQEAYDTAQPGQFIEVNLPIAVYEHLYEQAPADQKSVTDAQVALNTWLMNQLGFPYTTISFYLDVAVQDRSWISKLGLTEPKIKTQKGLMPSLYADGFYTKRQTENVVDFRFYCYFVKPLD